MTKDMLAAIMDAQNAFQETVPNGVVDQHMYSDDAIGRAALMSDIRTHTLACINELNEALNETGWKPWASSDHLNRPAFRRELIDAFRFLLNLFIIAGLSPEGVYELYMESLDKTNARVANGYDGVSDKCPGCKRSYADNPSCIKPIMPFDGSHTLAPIPFRPAWCAERGAFVDTTGATLNYNHPTGEWVNRS